VAVRSLKLDTEGGEGGIGAHSVDPPRFDDAPLPKRLKLVRDRTLVSTLLRAEPRRRLPDTEPLETDKGPVHSREHALRGIRDLRIDSTIRDCLPLESVQAGRRELKRSDGVAGTVSPGGATANSNDRDRRDEEYEHSSDHRYRDWKPQTSHVGVIDFDNRF
jgi:hypothetical protein